MEAPAKLYSKTSSFQRDVGRKLISKITFPMGAKILDLGCGTGELTAEMADLVKPTGRVVAMDPDKERIKLAKENNFRDNIDYIVGSDTTFPEDEYDVIFMNCVIHWIKDKEELFKHIFNNLCRGGLLAFTSGPHTVPCIIENLLESVAPGFLNDVYFKRLHIAEIEEYEQMQKAAGFRQNSFEVDSYQLRFDSGQACVEWFTGVVHGDLRQANRVKVYDEEVQNNPMTFNMQFYALQKPSKNSEIINNYCPHL